MIDKISKDLFSIENIRKLVYYIRNEQVMLDYDLAVLYGYEVKKLNQQVKRHINRFPKDFMFQLTNDEVNFVKSQFATSPIKGFFQGQDGGVRKLPYAFTEQGIYQLATVLNGDIAEQTSILIMRTFRKMREFISDNRKLLPTDDLKILENKQKALEIKVDNIEKNMVSKSEINNFISIFNSELENNMLMFNGEPFKADLAFQKIFKKAKDKIFIIDDYIGIKTLEHLRSVKAKITIFSDNKGKHLTHQELIDFQKEYPNVTLSFKRTGDKIHDRYIIIDYKTNNEQAWHLGSSIKDVGSKVTTINKFDDVNLIHFVIEDLLKNTDKII